MEALIPVHLIKWSKGSKGIAGSIWAWRRCPASKSRRWLPLGCALACFFYEHGEPSHNFQGLRAYKDKFDPAWDPRYLAYPGGLGLARIRVTSRLS